ncbi:hypothetical protein K402DRAFT_395584, partial [Aulographum hederae CBS 113979]
HQVAQETAEIERLRPNKRKRITIDPQKTFADIQDVLIARARMDTEEEQHDDIPAATRISARKKKKSTRQVEMEELEHEILE